MNAPLAWASMTRITVNQPTYIGTTYVRSYLESKFHIPSCHDKAES
jgi:hypothetical protein